MTLSDPSTAPRQRDSGYKGDAWSVNLPTDPSDLVLVLDTGVDSVAIAHIPDPVWDRGPGAPAVHAHDGYDQTLLIPRGTGTLFHGPDPDHITASRFEAPVVIVCPAGSWHQIVMDPEVFADGTSFFTVAGTVIVPFADQMASVTRDRVMFADLAVVETVEVRARTWVAPPARPSIEIPRVDPPVRDASDPPSVRIIPYEAPESGYVLPLDTGTDSLFILASDDAPQASEPFVAPEVLDLHRHADVDEYIVRAGGAGWIVNGATSETVTLTPFRGPCLLVMPAGALHRVLQTELSVGAGILIYADRRAIVERHETIMARTSVATIDSVDTEETLA